MVSAFSGPLSNRFRPHAKRCHAKRLHAKRAESAILNVLYAQSSCVNQIPYIGVQQITTKTTAPPPLLPGFSPPAAAGNKEARTGCPLAWTSAVRDFLHWI
jgi:hypothetical protein